jgi:RNA polymerase sigma-70 factor (ECF subfamily)
VRKELRKGVPVEARSCERFFPTPLNRWSVINCKQDKTAMSIAQAIPNQAAHRIQAPVEVPDKALLQAISAGEQHAMRILFARHNVRVYRFALSITKDQPLAEEVVGDVFFDVWRRAGSFKGRSQVSTWLLAIARHKAISSVRKHAYERSNEELADTIADTADDPEVALQSKQPRTILAYCLQQLPAIHREIIDLVYYHQKSIGEVGEILKIPRNTVKTRMFYARKRIAEVLAVTRGAGTSLADSGR